MSTFRAGNVTVTLTGTLDAFVRRAAGQAVAVVRERMETVAETVQSQAQSDWYTEVHRRTGRSGVWRVVSRTSGPRATVGLVSADTRTDKATGQPVALVVARDGKPLVEEIIRIPFRAQVRVVTPELGRAVAERLRRGA